MWYYTISGTAQGPVDEAGLDKLLGDGTVTPATLVWKEGLTDWVALAKARPPGSVGALDAATGTCSMCGKIVGADNLIDLLGHRVCAACKPLAVQSLKEGASPAAVGLPSAWADGKKIVTRDQAVLPRRCVKCNQPTSGPAIKLKVYWLPSWYYLLIPIGYVFRAGIIIFVVVSAIVRKRATVEVCLCPKHEKRRQMFRIGGWSGAGLGFLLIICGAVWKQIWLVLPGTALLVGAILIGGIIGARQLRASRIDKSNVWLTGAHKDFIASLPIWTGQ